LLKPDDCSHTDLAYWAKGLVVSIIDIDRSNPHSQATTGSAVVNGANVHVLFDTGAATSMISVRAASAPA
jgi:predicted aspartyl protease